MVKQFQLRVRNIYNEIRTDLTQQKRRRTCWKRSNMMNLIVASKHLFYYSNNGLHSNSAITMKTPWQKFFSQSCAHAPPSSSLLPTSVLKGKNKKLLVLQKSETVCLLRLQLLGASARTSKHYWLRAACERLWLGVHNLGDTLDRIADICRPQQCLISISQLDYNHFNIRL
jgi:hypothetical protein